MKPPSKSPLNNATSTIQSAKATELPKNKDLNAATATAKG